MTYRHVHCVYCEYQGNDICKCLKHNKLFDTSVKWMKNHCDDLILNPTELLSYIFKNQDKTLNWDEAFKLIETYLQSYGFAGMVLKNKRSI